MSYNKEQENGSPEDDKNQTKLKLQNKTELEEKSKIWDDFYIDESDEIYKRKDPIYTEINNYIEGEVIGKGSFGTVKEYINKITFERFAAKIFFKQNKDRRIRFMDNENEDKEDKGKKKETDIKREIHLARKLNHKNIMKIIESFSVNETIYLILEFCPRVLEAFFETESGEDIKKLPKSQSHWYFCQLIEGVEYLHSRGIIHRDLKPANILIDNSNNIKIADFGTSKELNLFTTNDMISEYKGSPSYQPPELLNWDSNIQFYSGSKFDIWSIGVILFQMISGNLPFLPIEEFMDNVINHPVKYPEEILKDIGLLDLLNKMLVKDFHYRITAEDIKKHSWFISKWTQNDFIKELPKSKKDLLGTMSVLPFIHHKYNPKDQNKVVTKEEFEASLDRTPLVRGDRLFRNRSPPKKKWSPGKRLIKLGLYSSKED